MRLIARFRAEPVSRRLFTFFVGPRAHASRTLFHHGQETSNNQSGKGTRRARRPRMKNLEAGNLRKDATLPRQKMPEASKTLRRRGYRNREMERKFRMIEKKRVRREMQRWMKEKHFYFFVSDI